MRQHPDVLCHPTINSRHRSTHLLLTVRTVGLVTTSTISTGCLKDLLVLCAINKVTNLQQAFPVLVFGRIHCETLLSLNRDVGNRYI